MVKELRAFYNSRFSRSEPFIVMKINIMIEHLYTLTKLVYTMYIRYGPLRTISFSFSSLHFMLSHCVFPCSFSLSFMHSQWTFHSYMVQSQFLSSSTDSISETCWCVCKSENQTKPNKLRDRKTVMHRLLNAQKGTSGVLLVSLTDNTIT